MRGLTKYGKEFVEMAALEATPQLTQARSGGRPGVARAGSCNRPGLSLTARPTHFRDMKGA
jgi:hypothetical protein